MPHIQLESLWTDTDEMLQLDITASNDAQVGRQDFYVYPEQLEAFARELMAFPKDRGHTVSLEYGEDPQFYCYVRIRALVLDSRGHSALEVSLDNRQDPPLKAESLFYMACEPATVNVFGKNLLSWTKEMTEPLRYEWKNA